MSGGAYVVFEFFKLNSSDTIRRDFLLFIPATAPNLRAVLSYYSSTVQLNAEGDVHVTDDTVEGSGKTQFPRNLLGALFSIVKPSQRPKSLPDRVPDFCDAPSHTQITHKSKTNTFPWDPGEHIPDNEDAFHSSYVSQDQLMPSETGFLTDLLPDPGVLLRHLLRLPY